MNFMNDIKHVDRNTIRLPIFPKIACSRYTVYTAFDEMHTVTISSFPTWQEKSYQMEVHVVNLLLRHVFNKYYQLEAF